MDLQVTVVIDEAQLPEFVHKLTDRRPGRRPCDRRMRFCRRPPWARNTFGSKANFDFFPMAEFPVAPPEPHEHYGAVFEQGMSSSGISSGCPWGAPSHREPHLGQMIDQV